MGFFVEVSEGHAETVNCQAKLTPKITVKRDVTNWKGRFETGPVAEAGKSRVQIKFFRSSPGRNREKDGHI